MKELVGIAEQVAAKLIARKQTIAVAESSTGGLISASLLAVPGASAYFLGGAVVYTRDARRALMDISDEGMKGFRSSSEPYAKLLADFQSIGAEWIILTPHYVRPDWMKLDREQPDCRGDQQEQWKCHRSRKCVPDQCHHRPEFERGHCIFAHGC